MLVVVIVSVPRTPASVTDPAGNKLTRDYDAVGNPATVAPPQPRGATSYAYGSLSRITTKRHRA